jgi:hypothetical protein
MTAGKIAFIGEIDTKIREIEPTNTYPLMRLRYEEKVVAFTLTPVSACLT